MRFPCAVICMSSELEETLRHMGLSLKDRRLKGLAVRVTPPMYRLHDYNPLDTT